MDKCPCGSDLPYSECCGPLIRGERLAATAEQVMRSRYTAYVLKELPYLCETLHPDYRKDYDEKSTRSWAESATWHGLKVISTEKGGPEDIAGQVEFIASYTQQDKKIDHHEIASFERREGKWYFVKGEGIAPRPVVRSAPKVGRNDPCVCGSGKKFKKCCGQ